VTSGRGERVLLLGDRKEGRGKQNIGKGAVRGGKEEKNTGGLKGTERRVFVVRSEDQRVFQAALSIKRGNIARGNTIRE